MLRQGWSNLVAELAKPYVFEATWDDDRAAAITDLLGIGLDASSGPFQVTTRSSRQVTWYELVVHPEHLRPGDVELLAQAQAQFAIGSLPYHVQLQGAMIRQLAADPESARDEPAGSDLRDPRMSAPELVAEVAASLVVPDDAAALFLMVLALPDPTTKNIRTWTGWTAKQLTAAVAPLVAAEVLIEAKRARAGRSFFLPGPWVALRAPHLPIEGWKAEMYGLTGTHGDELRAGFLVPWEPVPAVFAQTWQRWQAGDRPGHTGFDTD